MRSLLPILMLLTACQRSAEPTPPTAAENARLDEAEEMLNDLANAEGAAPEGTAPTVNQQ
jgi:hypothetical protein